MAQVLPQANDVDAESGAFEDALAVAVCGTFRRAVDQLRADIVDLAAARCMVVSPADLDFVSEVEGFVYARHELNRNPSDIESEHLAAVRSADLVWLHAPEGYIGPSGAFELGAALGAGVPVFSRQALADVALRAFVHVVQSPAEAAERRRTQTLHSAGAPIEPLQRYYRRAAAARGWGEEGPSECMLLLTEEVGELARAVRLRLGLARSDAADVDVGEELADVQLYLVHLANILSVDLSAAVTSKEEKNTRRHLLRNARAA